MQLYAVSEYYTPLFSLLLLTFVVYIINRKCTQYEYFAGIDASSGIGQNGHDARPQVRQHPFYRLQLALLVCLSSILLTDGPLYITDEQDDGPLGDAGVRAGRAQGPGTHGLRRGQATPGKRLTHKLSSTSAMFVRFLRALPFCSVRIGFH